MPYNLYKSGKKFKSKNGLVEYKDGGSKRKKRKKNVRRKRT